MSDSFDLVVIGGGINGAGIARDAASRGLRVALCEQADWCYGTSRWSSRLIHGGLRYLEHLEFGLVRESLREREILLAMAPHLVRPLPLLVPCYRGARRGPGLLRFGLWLYDRLAWDRSLPGHRMLTTGEALALAPGLQAAGLLGAGQYHDAQVTFPERLVLENVLAAAAAGATLLSYHRVDRVLARDGQVQGVRVTDLRRETQLDLAATVVVNAAGPWVDRVLLGLAGGRPPLMGGTKGSHLVLPRFADAPTVACYAEAAADGRPFFVLPWQDDLLLVGTTDIRYTGDPGSARADAAEIDYLLQETNRLFPDAALTRRQVLYHYTGVRPLPRQTGRDAGAITRRHTLHHHRREARGLFSVIGGKLTTYRHLAEQVTDRVARQLHRRLPACTTAGQPLPGAAGLDAARDALAAVASLGEGARQHLLNVYGGRAAQVLELAAADPSLAAEICPHTHALAAEVVFAFREELATTLADVLLRRCMAGLGPDQGRAALPAALAVARRHLGWSEARADAEERRYLREIGRLAEMPGGDNHIDL